MAPGQRAILLLLQEVYNAITLTTLRGAVQEATEYLSAKTHAETDLQT
jgi:hypothetical protein